MTRKFKFGWFLAVAVAASVAGCDTTSPGDRGDILFTPIECGRINGCAFADSIGVGGAVQVHIEGAAGLSTAGMDLVSSDPSVMTVTAISDVQGAPTWELFGVAPGVAGLEAIDRDGLLVDSLDVGVQELSGLRLDNFVGDAVGPETDIDFDEIWTINADEIVSFFVTPLIGEGVPTMGIYDYEVLVSPELAEFIQPESDLTAGYIAIEAPAGDYAVTFDNLDGHVLDVLFQVQ